MLSILIDIRSKIYCVQKYNDNHCDFTFFEVAVDCRLSCQATATAARKFTP